MKHRLHLLALCLMLALTSCSQQPSSPDTEGSDVLQLVSTTTMLHDLAQVIGGEHISATCLVTPGVDPHLYEATAKDISLLEQADVVLYHGLHLEGKMGDLFQNMEQWDLCVLSVEQGLSPTLLLADQDDPNVYDPHIWFDISLWAEVAEYFAQGLSDHDPQHQEDYQANLQDYLLELEALNEEIQAEIEKIPAQSRVLITAHDAFQYFGRGHGFEVMGIQGTATNTEATTQDMSNLADFIVEREIRAIFVESSVSSKNMLALQEAVQAQGFSVDIGGELYSDSLGDGEHGTYINTFRANVQTIVQALEGESP